VLFVYTDASKEEEGAARVVDHAIDLCAWARVDDAMFKAVERGRRWCDERHDGGRGGGGGGCGFDFHHHDPQQQWQPDGDGLGSGPSFFYFLKIDFLCGLLTADTKNRLFFVSHIWYRL
jgi:hypothetical protein